MQVISTNHTPKVKYYIIRDEGRILNASKENGITRLLNHKGTVTRDLISGVIESIAQYENERTHRSMMSNFVINDELNNLDENF